MKENKKLYLKKCFECNNDKRMKCLDILIELSEIPIINF